MQSSGGSGVDEPGVHTVGAGRNMAGEGGNTVGKGSGLGGMLGAGTREHTWAWAFTAADKASSLVQHQEKPPFLIRSNLA